MSIKYCFSFFNFHTGFLLLPMLILLLNLYDYDCDGFFLLPNKLLNTELRLLSLSLRLPVLCSLSDPLSDGLLLSLREIPCAPWATAGGGATYGGKEAGLPVNEFKDCWLPCKTMKYQVLGIYLFFFSFSKWRDK